MSRITPYIRDGVNQAERLLPALDSQYVQLDERRTEEILQFLYQLGSEIHLYDFNYSTGQTLQNVLPAPSEIAVLIEKLSGNEPQEVSPSDALILTFIQLFQYAQSELNQFTKKHLDFYFQEVLQIQTLPPVPDQVQVYFELGNQRSLTSFRLPAGSALDGTKDARGNPRSYMTDREIVINKGKIDRLKTLFVDQDINRSRIFVAPVANSIDGLGLPLPESQTYWPTLGEPQLNKGLKSRNMVDAEIGFALSSPILEMNEGAERTATLTFNLETPAGFTPDNFLQDAFQVFCTGPEGWFEPSSVTSSLIPPDPDIWQLQVTITLAVDLPPFTFYDPNIYTEGYAVEWPVVRLMLKPDKYAYDTIKALSVQSADIKVAVSGMKDLVIQNDQGVLDAGSPFFPFGPQPVLGNKLMIGNREIFSKKLTDFSVNLSWKDVPDADLGSYYSLYDPDPGTAPNITNNSFEYRVDLLLNKNWDSVLRTNNTLFDSGDASSPLALSVDAVDFNAATAATTYLRSPSKEPILAFGKTSSRGFARLVLISPDAPMKAFGHKEFPALYARQAIALARWDEQGQEPLLPNPPYTPTVEDITVGYTSEETIVFEEENAFDTLMQLGPWGYKELGKEGDTALVAQFRDEGELLLGIVDVTPPTTVNLLFKLEEDTADKDTILSKEDIQWSYLSQNTWKPIQAQDILVEGTLGFKKSGIVSLVIPQDASLAHTLLEAGRLWIKVSARQNAVGANQTREIFTNAVSATFAIDDADETKYEAHLQTPLEAGTIKKLKQTQSEIKKIVQPFSSFGGQASEESNAYYTRVSERLRHKKRACQIWDYERMAMSRFPGIFKAKALAHTDPSSFRATGATTLIVVNDLQGLDASNPFMPRVSRAELEEIQTYLSAYVSPFAKLYVENPVYETLVVDAKIGFRTGFDPGFYSNLLNEELKAFLSPWAFDTGVDIVIGGKIYKSSILQFIETREYVDFVVDIRLYHNYQGTSKTGTVGQTCIGVDFVIGRTQTPGIGGLTIGQNFIIGKDQELATASTPKSILVSSTNHKITAVADGSDYCKGASSLGIGFMTIDIDFVVATP
ncbi:MAG: baseplate J/gp47 family protein [Bacteroidota bacterium]